ncbi:uncharacterized protein LOC111603809 [Drosophila hydei]|uniref:Uncharacterized protein LOC111603809 n=1 Tax=Drosophila hydei TaxID=7224 RepID=A0A6J1MEG0_DROHY|nr:uncharacterized protein LOC111603809 [Drosophila hydei]XP_023177330.1 uncharacterized protein LOC111603809 [Drosophila hydei]
MTPIHKFLSSFVARTPRLLKSSSICCEQFVRFSKTIFEAGKAKENVHFLRMQREQLKDLRQKILKEKDVIKDRIEQLDKQIDSIKRKNVERGNSKI